MSTAQVNQFLQDAQALDFDERIQVIKILLETLDTHQSKKDTSFIDAACGCISHEQADELRKCCGLTFKEV